MWRIYTSWDNVFLLSKVLFEEGILAFHFVESDVYLSDDAYRRALDYVQSHEDFGEFSSEYVSFDEFKTIIDNLRY